jgi:murein DD-endopeptidase MepM/ murein hydrolase activator NlpD
MADMMNSMNLGGGATTGASKVTRAFAGLGDEVKKALNDLKSFLQITKEIEATTGKAAKNLKTAHGYGGGGTGGRTAHGFVDSSGSGMSFGSFLSGMKSAAVVGVTAATQAINLEQFAENSMSRARVGFYSGQGSAAASMSFQTMMNRGTGIDPLDAARAAMAGNSMGLSSALPGYGTVSNGAATFSNLVPGAGLAGGMQAMAALNQARNVNSLRMIGIQVRDPSTGTMRSPDAIAGDLWNKLNSQKTGSRAISKQDLAISLQSGNSLDSMLTQYFGNDPVLRQGIVTALMQKAGGGDLSKESLIKSGALPELANSTGERNAASFGAIDANTSAVEQGMMGANAVIKEAANLFRDGATTFSGAVTALSFAMQLSGGGNGAIGTLGAGALGGLSNLGSMLGGGLSAIGGGMLLKQFGPKLMQAGGTLLKGASRLLPGVGAVAATGLGAVDQYSGAQAGEGFNWGNALLSSGSTALGALMLSGGNPLVAAAAGLGSFGVQAGAHMLGGGTLFGDGTGEGSEADADGGGVYNPLASMSINAPYLQNREGTSVDGKPTQKQHKGVDLRGKIGDSVRAIKGGVVEISKDGAGSYGRYIKIKHNDGHRSVYAHLNKRLVSAGAQVRAGQEIGHVGSTGQSSGPHLHLEVWNGTNQDAHVDPLGYLGGAGSAVAAGVHSNDASATAITNKSLLFGESQGQLLPGMSASSGIGGGSEGGYSSGGISYGGVNINITVPKNTSINEQTLAREIKRVLNDQDMLQKAVSR